MPGPVHFLAGMIGPWAHKTILCPVLLPQPNEGADPPVFLT